MPRPDKVDLDWLKKDWTNWVRGLEIRPTEASIQASWNELVRRYGEPQRVYHTLHHIRQVLQTLYVLDWWDDAVWLAAYLHDVVYDPKANDNEVRSADFARNLLPSFELEPDQIEEVERLILLTRTHQTTMGDESGQALLDADLAILGAAPEVYNHYAGEIRQEYAWVSDEAYRNGRIQVLERFLERPFIYHTFLRTTHEEQAHANLSREIATLRSGRFLS